MLYLIIYFMAVHIGSFFLGLYLQEKITKLSILKKSNNYKCKCHNCDGCCD